MDNFHIDITSVGSLVDAMKIAFGRHTASHYATRLSGNGKPTRMIFFWHDPDPSMKTFKDVAKFPFQMDAVGAADFASRWLLQTAEYDEEPDHDGDNKKGWRIYNEAWGRVDDSHDAICAISPVWAMYGK